MKHRTPLIVALLGLSFALLAGCAALDKIAPQYAAQPAVTTGPTTQPAQSANVPAQVGVVLEKVASDPSAQSGAAVFGPYGSLGLSAIGALGALAVYIFGHKNGQTNGQAAQQILGQTATAVVGAVTQAAMTNAANANANANAAPANPAPAATPPKV